MNIHRDLQKAIELYQAGDRTRAESICREIIGERPDHADTLHLLGVICLQSGDYDSAIKYLERAIRYIPSNAYVHYNLGNAYKDKKLFSQAISSYEKALRINPNLFEAHHNLGMAFKAENRVEEAIACYQKALQINPGLADAYYNLGVVFQDRGQLDDAIAYYQAALKIDPGFADAYYNLGNIFLDKRQLDEAASCYQKTSELRPDLASPYYNLGVVLEEKGMLVEAESLYRKALQTDPNLADAYNNLGNLASKKYAFDEAMMCYRQALVLKPHFIEALVNLGNLMKDFGQSGEAERCYRHALKIRPDCYFCHQNLLFSMNYSYRYDAQAIFEEHLEFAERFERPLFSAILPHANEKVAGKRLKIGYVSPDFRRHPVSSFIEPVLGARNRESFEIFCYSDLPYPDEVTERIRARVDQWRDISRMPDEGAAELVRKDAIDILIDLAGHTAHNRMLLFARKPAPVQVSWIGYPATTGLSSMDYKIVDGYTDPPGMTERFYTEKLIRTPDCFLCYLPELETPDLRPLPAMLSGHITFGSCNNFAKVSPEVIELWTRILKTLDGSRLLMKAKSLSSAVTRDYVLDMFTQRGLAAERIELLSWEPSVKGHLDTYNRIDIGLDTFPYNGTTTTCEALLMGVPVITLAGKTHASRVGMSLLSNVGLPALIARTYDEYVEIAVSLANDLKELERLRENLRDMMKHSPLTDAERFTVNLEACYRKTWEDWCESR